jgi:hypothetical protein
MEAIEAAFAAERDALLGAQRRELDALSDARRNLEARAIDARTAAEESHTHELYATQAAESASSSRRVTRRVCAPRSRRPPVLLSAPPARARQWSRTSG